MAAVIHTYGCYGHIKHGKQQIPKMMNLQMVKLKLIRQKKKNNPDSFKILSGLAV